MNIRLLTSAEDLRKYDQWVKGHPGGTLWQSLEWKAYQEALGRETRIYWEDNKASALVVIDRTAFRLTVWDIPRGPLSKSEALIKKILEGAKADNALSVYFSPVESLKISGALTSSRHEQPQATRILDLTVPESDILAQMHEKGRYNIKVAQKHGILVEKSTDLNAWMKLVEETSTRDGFTHVSRNKYEAFMKSLPGSFLLIAKNKNGEAIAGLMGVTWNGQGIYYYGASSYQHRALMAPYLVQWEAIRRCKALKCSTYDLLGIAPPNSPEDHPWQGISSFKAKFGGNVVLYPPEQEVTLKPVVKGLLGLKRRLFG